MTVPYRSHSRSGFLRGFASLLFRWRGSVYKMIYRELLVFLLAYFSIRILYRYGLNPDQRNTFERLTLFCAKNIDWIPLHFILGFYISIVVQAWWTQLSNIPTPDSLLATILIHVDGSDEPGHVIRRNLIRYWNLSFVLIMQSISAAVKQRFPTLQHVVRAGYMTKEELAIYKHINTSIPKMWIPLIWFLDLLREARSSNRIKSDVALKHIVVELNETRSKFGMLCQYDQVPLPLVYTQVVTWAVYLFFFGTLVGRQYLDPAKKYKGHEIDLYVPIFTLVEFVFYMGWMKVAESLFNPFGNDDDDIEVNLIIDRHLKMSHLLIDQVRSSFPTYATTASSSTPTQVLSEEDETEERRGLVHKNWTSVFGMSNGGVAESGQRTVGTRVPLLTFEVMAKMNRG